MFGEFSKSSVTVDHSSSMSIIVYGPSNQGINFATRFSPDALYSFLQFSVDKCTRPPIINGNVREQVLLA